MAASPDGQLLIVSHGSTSRATVIDIAKDNSASKTEIDVGDGPEEALFLKDSKTIIVANRGSKSLDIFDATGLTKICSVDIGLDLSHQPGAISASPITDEIYVACPLSSTVVVINRLGEIVGQVHIAGAPIFISSLAGAPLMYVLDSVKHTLTFIDPIARQSINTLGVGRTPLTAYEAIDMRLLLVIGFEEKIMSITDYSNFSVIDKAPLGGRPFGTAVMYKKKIAYVASEDDHCINIIPLARLPVSVGRLS
jgi:DNA-binding beta-propeller fold protein YncE